MVRPQSELQNALEVEKREHEQTTKKLRQLLDKKGAEKEEKAPLSASESQTLADALGLLQLYEKQGGAMQAMPKDAAATRSGRPARSRYRAHSGMISEGASLAVCCGL